MPIVLNMADTVNWVFYDSFTIAAAAAGSVEYQMFSVPMNQGGKTKLDTNMTLVQQLPPPKFFNCLSIGFYLKTNQVKADADAILNSYYYEFWVSEKIYSEGLIWQKPSGGGLSGYTTLASQQTWANGIPSTFNKASLSLPAGLALQDPSGGESFTTNGITNGISILQGQTFLVKVIAPTAPTADAAGTGIKVYCCLEGILSRQVQ